MSGNSDTLVARIALSMLQGMEVSIAERLLNEFGTPLEILRASESELKVLSWLPRSMVSAQTRYQAIEKAKREVEFLDNSKVSMLWYSDERYPRRLLRAERAPVLIYTLGELDLNTTRTIGIVGTRHATAYGNSFTERLIKDLSSKVDNIVTVSGLAYGIDIAAHRASLEAGVPTIGIIAHGFTKMYPAAHRDTAARMVKNGGMMISDYEHDATVNGYNFLSRNRLVAALSDALVVVESAQQGGALSTARHSMKCGVPVFAVPGRVTDNYSVGCNKLLATGAARCLTDAEDIINFMQWPVKESHETPGSPAPLTDLSKDEKILLNKILTVNGCDNDMLVATVDMPVSRVMSMMIGLEMKGYVSIAPGNRYQVLRTIDPSQLL